MAIETVEFGRTGHESTRVLFGAAALARADQATADRAMALILEHGVNHIDVARGYGDAERLLGPWMETHRDRFFLASEDALAGLRRGAVGHPRVAGAAAHRPPGPDPTAQPQPPRRVGAGAGTRRGAGSGPGGARAGPGALHRRDRPQLDDRRAALPRPAALRLRLRAAALELVHARVPALRGGLRADAGAVPGAGRGGADDQVAGPRGVAGRRAGAAIRPGTSRWRIRPTSASQCAGSWGGGRARRGRSSTRPAT